MGTTTNGFIFYGFVFDEDHRFPWMSEDGEGEIDDWWLKVTGFTPSVDPFDEEGNYKDGPASSPSSIKKYFAERDAWQAEYPLPVVVENYCSADFPMYALAVPGTVTTGRRGDPTALPFGALNKSVSLDKVNAFLEFCEKYEIKPPHDLRWFVASYWG